MSRDGRIRFPDDRHILFAGFNVKNRAVMRERQRQPGFFDYGAHAAIRAQTILWLQTVLQCIFRLHLQSPEYGQRVVAPPIQSFLTACTSKMHSICFSRARVCGKVGPSHKIDLDAKTIALRTIAGNPSARDFRLPQGFGVRTRRDGRGTGRVFSGIVRIARIER